MNGFLIFCIVVRRSRNTQLFFTMTENTEFLPRGLVTFRRTQNETCVVTPVQTQVQRRLGCFEISGMNIGVASAEHSRKRSTLTIENRKHVTSAALGISRPAEGRCLSCWNNFSDCPGHVGHIETPHYIHPLTVSVVTQLMSLVCHVCARPLIDVALIKLAVESDLMPEHVFASVLRAMQTGRAPVTSMGASVRMRHLIDFVKRMGSCVNCGAPVHIASVYNGHSVALGVNGQLVELRPLYIKYILLRVIPDDLFMICGIDPINFPPANYICETLTVSPPNTRPSDLVRCF